MSDEIISSIIQSVGMIIAVAIGFYVSKKTKKLDWHEEHAKEFMQCTKEYNRTISNMLCNVYLACDKNTSVEKDAILSKEISEQFVRILYLEYEIRRLASSARKTKDEFLNSHKELHGKVNELKERLMLRKEGRISTVQLEQAQKTFDKDAQRVHEELCSL